MQVLLSRGKSESHYATQHGTASSAAPTPRMSQLLSKFASTSSKLHHPTARRWRWLSRRLLVLTSLVFVVSFLLWSSYRTGYLLKDNLGMFSATKTKATRANRLPLGELVTRRFQCVAWRSTGECNPSGPLEPQNDKNCSEVITQEVSGYCEVEDLDSGERFQVMHRHCNGLKNHVQFRCSDAPDFANYHVEGAQAVNNWIASNVSLYTDGHSLRDGIIMVVYPKLVASAYATVRVLRDVLSCTLPIEIWFNVDELADFRGLFAPLQQLAISVGGISFHPMRGSQAKGFYSKIFAIQNSFFDRVLFLDADNVPVRDPSFLFESPEFVTTGAVFWPDFWQPSRTLFNLFDTSMLWELLDLPFIDMFEQESGQLLVDRVRHSAPLELVNFYAFHEPNYFQKLDLVYGDKDLFRLAWMKLNASFHMVQTPPAMAGRVTGGSFCGMTMAQHDANGEMLFLHRNQFKLTGERDSRFGNAAEEDPNALGAMQADGYPDPVIWTHLLSFNTTADSKMYLIDAYRAPPQFPDWQPCYGRRDVADLGVFYLNEFAKLTFANIETDLRRFAKEAIDLRP